MPIIKRKPLRTNAPHFFYFKGTPAEALKIQSRQLNAIARITKNPFTDIPGFRTTLSKAIKVAQECKQGSVFTVATKQGILALRVKTYSNGQILIRQQPLTHGITGSFSDVMAILKKGFDSPSGTPNTILYIGRRGQAYPNHQLGSDSTFGDSYSLEIMDTSPTHGYPNKTGRQVMGIKKADPSKILAITIHLGTTNQNERQEKMEFYKEALQGWPVHFF